MVAEVSDHEKTGGPQIGIGCKLGFEIGLGTEVGNGVLEILGGLINWSLDYYRNE